MLPKQHYNQKMAALVTRAATSPARDYYKLKIKLFKEFFSPPFLPLEQVDINPNDAIASLPTPNFPMENLGRSGLP
ncbi:MAG: hypothetical protein KAS99_06020 [Candidatus Omnitrophica bacterium]|nr:hypothetical protein [Candidatus Omnitrophota bacterium]